jgi:hypothetical protein
VITVDLHLSDGTVHTVDIDGSVGGLRLQLESVNRTLVGRQGGVELVIPIRSVVYVSRSAETPTTR